MNISTRARRFTTQASVLICLQVESSSIVKERILLSLKRRLVLHYTYTFCTVQKPPPYNGILVVALSEGNLRNPFGVRRAPSEPASVLSVVKKNLRQILASKHPQSIALIAIFCHLSPISPAIIHLTKLGAKSLISEYISS